MKATVKTFLLIETAVCFIPALLLLALGLIMLPVQISFLFARAGDAGTTGALTVIALVAGGMAGVTALANVLVAILSPASSFLGRGWTLAGAVAGGAALLPYAVGPVDSAWWRLVGWMPLLCAVHVIYLGRAFLFPNATRHDEST
jgi:hypothetical protein